jgi:hypothetical protein
VRRVVNDGQVYNSREGCPDPSGHMDMAMNDSRAGLAFTTALALPHIEAGRATVDYTLAQPGEVTLAIFDVAGRRVASLADGVQAMGAHSASVKLQHVARGIYFVKMRAGGKVLVRRMPILGQSSN